MDQEARTQLTNLMSAVRWSTLATTNADGSPLASEIAFACLRADGLVVHLSQLAKHTRNLMERPQFSLSVSEPDDGREDPQTLARASLSGRCESKLRSSAQSDSRSRTIERAISIRGPTLASASPPRATSQ